jgi:hypothetical protein
MRLAEPMTLATDYALALLGWWLGLRLRRSGSGPGDPRRTWGAVFWAMSAAALLGGTSHGFAPYFNESAGVILWNATMVAIGVASGFLFQAAVETVARPGAASLRLRRAAGWLVAAEVVAYSLWVCFVDNDFGTAVVQYGTAMSLVLVLHLVLAVRRRPGAWWIVGGVVVSFLGAWIQQAGIAPHPSFNHNDLYHVVQMVGLWGLFRGALHARPR